MAKVKKKEEPTEPIPSTIRYRLSVPEVKEDMLEMLSTPVLGVMIRVVDGDTIVISYDRELSLDEAVIIGSILGKWETMLINQLKPNI